MAWLSAGVPRVSGARSGWSDGHPHDIGTIVDLQGIAIRVGHHCAQPLMERLGLVSTARVSFGIYNTTADIDRLTAAIPEVLRIFG